MANALPVPHNLVTDAWVKATWEEFLALADSPELERARFYYDNGYTRIETMPIGSGHSQDNTLLSQTVSLYGTIKNIRIKGFTNGSFRKQSMRECQPDMAFYIGADFKIPPKTSKPIDVDEFGAPHLVIEIASTTLNDDIGRKRLLYERLKVQEYWVVDAGEVIAFEVVDGGSKQIRESKVLPGLKISLIEEALKRSQAQDDGEVNRWLLQVSNG
ncbi:MAG: Uma2 family endonuclease [Leptolyngbyaceae cyanobacterium SL_5_9]|nr:Uma2 family endonuclease [Leptolyngbyaceae cyanobacterium SL_5_9]NJO75638.1 Uma2 family endonuclease [Leptolyngbyaceae cyanobacterium RM1_406_9]